jgi:regulator of sigma E protease
MSLTAAVLGLLVLIFIHELGHFGAAKLTGMRAIRFSIGFPPFLFRRQRGETEYAIGAIPLGGYVKIPGMLRPDEGDLWEVAALLEQGELPDERAAALGIAYDETRGALERSRWDDAQRALSRLEAELAVTELPEGDRRRAERAVHRVRDGLDPRGYWRCSRTQRLIVIAAGPFMNVVAAFLLLTVVAAIGKPQPIEPTTGVAAVLKDTPAAAAGLRSGDRIVAVDGVPVDSFGDVRRAITGSGGEQIVVTVERGDRRVELPPAAPEQRDGRWLLGFTPDGRYVTKSYPLYQAPGQAASDMWAMTSGTFGALAQIGSSEGRDQVSSVVGIVRYTADASDIGISYYLTLIALISLSLAIFNLLPFLPLDGGHILMLAVEKLRGRSISRSAFERASAVGIALMLVLFVIGLQNDLDSLLGTR